MHASLPSSHSSLEKHLTSNGSQQHRVQVSGEILGPAAPRMKATRMRHCDDCKVVHCKNSLGSVTKPVKAEAAAVYGEAR